MSRIYLAACVFAAFFLNSGVANSQCRFGACNPAVVNMPDYGMSHTGVLNLKQDPAKQEAAVEEAAPTVQTQPRIRTATKFRLRLRYRY